MRQIVNSLDSFVRRLADHKRSTWWLAFFSFIEAIIIPVPPDVLLVPLGIMRRDKVWWLATVTLVASVLGGVVGYAIGFYFSDFLEALMRHLGHMDEFKRAQIWFDAWGNASIVVAGFSPIPYKVFTLTAGLLQANLFGFIVASFLGRGLRFYLEALLIHALGLLDPITIKRVIIRLGWVMIILFLIAIFWGWYLHGA